MKIDKIIVGPLQENCYIISNNNKCIVVDPGDEFNKIYDKLKDKEVVNVIITHYHFDHIGCIDKFPKEKILDYSNLEEREYNIDNFEFEVIYTPGHKEDAITILFKNKNIMFTGDFIFRDSIGRTDLKGGDINKMKESLKKIMKYSDTIVIYPGHGDSTTLGYEKNNFKYYM